MHYHEAKLQISELGVTFWCRCESSNGTDVEPSSAEPLEMEQQSNRASARSTLMANRKPKIPNRV